MFPYHVSSVSLFYSTPIDHTEVPDIPNYVFAKSRNQIYCQAIYIDHNTLCVKHAAHQKYESLRAASISILSNMVNYNSYNVC